jgi:hypothetical protein
VANQTKRPHFVPACHVRAWADPDDQVAVKRRGRGEPFTPNVLNVAVDADLCGWAPRVRVERSCSAGSEAAWPRARDALRSDRGAVQGDDRDILSLVAALHLIRTREHVAGTQFLHEFADYSSRRPVQRAEIRAFLAEQHLRFEPSESQIEGARTLACVALNSDGLPSRDETLAISVNVAVTELGPRLRRMCWSVKHSALGPIESRCPLATSARQVRLPAGTT